MATPSFMDLPTFVVAAVVFVVIYFLFFSTFHELPPGPRGWPLLGNIFDIRKYGSSKLHLYYSDLVKKYGNVYRIYFGNKQTVVANGFDAVMDVLEKCAGSVSHRPSYLFIPQQTTFNGKGITWGEGEEWKQLRGIAQQALGGFGLGKVSFEDRVLDEVQALLDVLTHKADEPCSVRDDLDRAVINVIHNIVFGSRLEYSDSSFQQLVNDINLLYQSQRRLSAVWVLPWLRHLPPFRKHSKAFFKAHQSLRDYIEMRVSEHRQNFNPDLVRDYIDLFLKAEATDPESTAFTAGNLTRCVLDLFLGGVENTAASLDFGLLYMLQYPDVQEVCQEEIDKCVGPDQMVGMRDKSSLVYTTASVLEIQRMAAVAPFATLRTCYRDTWISGYRVPRDSLIHANLRSVLNDPEHWQTPHIFRPSRFLNDFNMVDFPDAWIPFGSGPRNCPAGMLAHKELFLFFANLLQNFRFTKANDFDLDLSPDFGGVTMNPKPYKLIASVRE